MQLKLSPKFEVNLVCKFFEAYNGDVTLILHFMSSFTELGQEQKHHSFLIKVICIYLPFPSLPLKSTEKSIIRCYLEMFPSLDLKVLYLEWIAMETRPAWSG